MDDPSKPWQEPGWKDLPREVREARRRAYAESVRTVPVRCDCGVDFIPGAHAAAHGRKCNDCWNAYRRELRQRHNRNDLADRRCNICGEPLNGLYGTRRLCERHTAIAQWAARREAKAAEEERQRNELEQELKNPTKDSTWWLIGQRKLSEARRALLEAQRSQSVVSAPAGNSPS